MKAILNDDIVVAVVSGDTNGVPVPAELASLPPERLRYVGGKFVDAASINTFHVDARGNRHAAKGAGRQAIRCAWDAELHRDGDTWVARSNVHSNARKIKSECRRRISASLKDATTQTNVSAYVSELLAQIVLDKGKLTQSEKTDIEIARAASKWAREMQATCRRLVADGVEDASSDSHWPSPPDGLADLFARF